MLVDWVLNDHLMISKTIPVYAALYYNKIGPDFLVKPNDSCDANSTKDLKNVS